jgi:hypothetical protein
MKFKTSLWIELEIGEEAYFRTRSQASAIKESSHAAFFR